MPYLLNNSLADCPKLADIRGKILRTRIFVGTTTAINGRPYLFQLKRFTLAIIDEASQILEPDLIGILSARHKDGNAIGKFVLIGDYKQLPAIALQSEEEGGDTDSDDFHDHDVVGLEGVFDTVSAVEESEEDDDCEDDGEDRLHEEQGGRALDVVDDSPPLFHDGRHGSEIGIEKDEVGGVPCGRSAVCHGDGAVGILHGEDVVDAIAGHADGVLSVLELFDDGGFLLWRDATEDGVLIDYFGNLTQGKTFQGNAFLRVRDIAFFGYFRSGKGVVSGYDLYLDAVFREPPDGIRSLRSNVIFESEDGYREHPSLDFPVLDVPLAFAEHDHAIAVCLLFGDVAKDGPIPILGIDIFRGAEDEGTEIVKTDGGEFSGGREGDVGLDLIVASKRIALGKGDGGLVGFLESVEIGTDQLVEIEAGIGHEDLVHFHRAVRQRSGLVQTKDIDSGEHFDAIEILDKRLFLCEVDDARRQGDGSQKIHAGWNHADDAAGRIFHGLGGDVPIVGEQTGLAGLEPLGAKSSDSQRNDDDGNDFDQHVERIEKLGFRLGIFLCLGLNAGGVIVVSDFFGANGAGTGNDERTGEDLVSDRLFYRQRFSGEKGFVDFDGSFEKNGIRRNLIAVGKIIDIVEDEFVRRDRVEPFVSTHLDGLGSDKLQLVDGILRFDFLDDTYDGIEDGDEKKIGRSISTEDDQGDRDGKQKHIEEGEDVGTKNLRNRFPGTDFRRIPIALLFSFVDLGGGEAF